jgi:hypothetical protein
MLAFWQSDLSRLVGFRSPQADHSSVAAFTGKIVAKFSLASISIVASAIYCLAIAAKTGRRTGKRRIDFGKKERFPAGRESSADPAQVDHATETPTRSPQGRRCQKTTLLFGSDIHARCAPRPPGDDDLVRLI